MMLQLSPRTVQELSVTGGVTLSVFPAVEAWLEESSDHQEALRFVARKKDMSRYESMIDFLFCEVFTRFRPACFRFYNDDGPPLRKMATQADLDRYERVLVSVLETARYAHLHERKQSWGWVVETAFLKGIA